jgi:hypothetical protein
MTDSSPPVYNPVSTSEENEDKPPSYFDVLSQIRAAKKDSSNPAQLAVKTVSIVCGSCNFTKKETTIISYFIQKFLKFLTVISTVLLAISLIVPIAMLIIGLQYKHRCTIQPYIPTWLIVMGAAGIANALMKFITNIIQCFV